MESQLSGNLQACSNQQPYTHYTPDELESLLWLGLDGGNKTNDLERLEECINWVH